MLIGIALVAVVCAVGALAIWRMEISRLRALDTNITGRVVGMRHSAERAEGTLPSRGVGVGGVRIVPESYVLEIDAAHGARQIVVDADTYRLYEIGDLYPRR